MIHSLVSIFVSLVHSLVSIVVLFNVFRLHQLSIDILIAKRKNKYFFLKVKDFLLQKKYNKYRTRITIKY